MLSYAISTAKSRASNYLWHLPIDEQEDAEIAAYQRKYLTWSSPTEELSSSGSGSTTNPEHTQDPPNKTPKLVDEIIASADLYHILGVENQPILERSRLRRAYLSRSRACHPDKFPNDPNATSAFQRVSIAYSILSKPSSRRSYDLHSQSNPSYDVFEHNFASEGVYERVKAEETFKGVVVAAFHEFLDGDLEMIRSLLRTINDLNPALSLTEESINTLLSSLESIRERALTCRTCIYALHSEISRLAELQQAFRNCRYLDLIGRSRITIQLTRTTLSLPVALERALIEQRVAKGMDDAKDGVVQEEPVKNVILPKHLRIFIRTLDTVLDTMERVLK